MEGIPSGFSNGKQLNALYSSEPVSVQLQESKSAGYKVWELKYADGSKALIRRNVKTGQNIIIKKIDKMVIWVIMMKLISLYQKKLN